VKELLSHSSYIYQGMKQPLVQKGIVFFGAVCMLMSLGWTDWMEEIKGRVVEMDNAAVLKRTREIKGYNMHEYRLGKYRKYNVDLTDSNHVHLFFNMYYDKNRLIANHDYIVSPYYHKGVKTELSPEGEVSEHWTFIRRDNYAVKLKRSIDYFHSSEIDSLRKELVMTAFDTIVLSREELERTIKNNKNLRKRF